MTKHSIDGITYKVDTFSRVAEPLNWVVYEDNDIFLGEAKEDYPAKEYVNVYAGVQGTHIGRFYSANMTMTECQLEITQALAAYFE